MPSGSELEPRVRTVVVTVNYRTPDLVIRSIEALAPEVARHGGIYVVAVDNDSNDGSFDVIGDAIERNGWSSWASVLASPVNRGLSAGNNLGVRHALERLRTPPDYFLLLNSDARVLPGAVAALEEFLDAHPSAGIAGSQLRTPDGKVWPYTFTYPSVLGEFEAGIQSSSMSERLSRWRIASRQGSSAPVAVDWVAGASMMVRREVFEGVGLMDEGYFLWFEETDLSLQAQRSGWSTWYVPDSAVVHEFGRSTGIDVNAEASRRLPQHWFDSRRRYYLKNHGRLYAAAADFGRLAGVLSSRVRRRIRGQVDLHPPRFLGDCARNSVFVRVPWRRPDPHPTSVMPSAGGSLPG
jgi:GT2 family glycosyltransferase